MILRQPLRLICAVAAACVLFAGAAAAQSKPSANALALAKELVAVKGASTMFDPIVDGVIRTYKDGLLGANPNLGKPLADIEIQLRAEYAPRRAEVQNQVVTAYATHFTEAELKDAIAFYKSPLGKKLLTEEPKVLDDTMKAVNDWSDKFAHEVSARLRSELKKKGFNPIQ